MNDTLAIRLIEGNERTSELLRRSTERIRISLELLDHDLPIFLRRQEKPICKGCGAAMSWSRSSLDAAERAVTSVFTCDRCGMVEETTADAGESVER
jgi:hypothetical protein